MTLRVAKKAIDDGDVQAYNALLDSAYGKAKQSLEIEETTHTPIDYSLYTDQELAIIKQAQELLSNQRNQHIEQADVIDE